MTDKEIENEMTKDVGGKCLACGCVETSWNEDYQSFCECVDCGQIMITSDMSKPIKKD